MSLLQTILAAKRAEVEAKKRHRPAGALEASPLFGRKIMSLRAALTQANGSGVIAEFKRKSPSKGNINAAAGVKEVTSGYARAGAVAISVLVDRDFFGGAVDDLTAARSAVSCPLLCKEFIVDEYQIIEAKACGADAILLIAAACTAAVIQRLGAFALSLGLEVLLEVHSAEEIKEHQLGDISLVGVNNRNLSDFSVDVSRSLELAARIPSHCVKIAESGLDSAAVIERLRKAGFSGFLIGEAFMRTKNPAEACARLITELRAGKP